ncbi:hypothetical protein AKO1_012956 [Acrasis kona]|uniref:F-box domain-containing protein n=1 Tax=Acrasis kona TaxID=1008807 RepID=A0AAW2Z0B8_9EUKA
MTTEKSILFVGAVDLDVDVWCEIFSFLSPQDLLQAICVCTAWKKWCFENRIWKYHLFRVNQPTETSVRHMTVDLQNRHIREGSYLHDDEDEQESWERQVRQDNLSACLYALVHVDSQINHGNTHVNLRQNRSLTDSAFLHLLKLRCEKKKKSRKKSQPNENQTPLEVRLIEHLILDSCEYLTDKSLLRLVKLHKRNSQILSLRHLSVEKCRFTTSGLHEILCISSQNLEYLNLSYNQYIFSHLFKDGIQLNRLTTLNLSGYPFSFESSDHHIINSLPNLIHLYLNECLMMTTDNLCALTSGQVGPKLQTLEICHNSYLTYRYFAQLYLLPKHGHHGNMWPHQCVDDYLSKCVSLINLDLSGSRLHRSFFYFGNLVNLLPNIECFKMNQCDVVPTMSYGTKCACSSGYLILPEHTVNVGTKWTKLHTLELEVDDEYQYRQGNMILRRRPVLHPKCIQHFMECRSLRKMKLGRNKRHLKNNGYVPMGGVEENIIGPSVCMTCSVTDIPQLDSGFEKLQQLSICLLDVPWNNLQFVRHMAFHSVNLTRLNLTVENLPPGNRRDRPEDEFTWDVIESFLESCGKLVKISLYPINKQTEQG